MKKGEGEEEEGSREAREERYGRERLVVMRVK